MSSDVFNISPLRAQLHWTQLALEQLVVGFMHVVLVLCKTVLICRHKVAFVAGERLCCRVTCTVQYTVRLLD